MRFTTMNDPARDDQPARVIVLDSDSEAFYLWRAMEHYLESRDEEFTEAFLAGDWSKYTVSLKLGAMKGMLREEAHRIRERAQRARDSIRARVAEMNEGA